MINIETTKAVFKLFQFIATAFGATDPAKAALQATLSESLRHDYAVGKHGRISLCADSSTRFGRKAEKGAPALDFEINWPGTGAQSWEVALVFGDALAHCARQASQCEAACRASGLGADDFETARETLDEIVKDVRARLSAGIPEGAKLDEVIKGCLEALGL